MNEYLVKLLGRDGKFFMGLVVIVAVLGAAIGAASWQQAVGAVAGFGVAVLLIKPTMSEPGD